MAIPKFTYLATILCCAWLAGAPSLAAQADSVTVAAGEHYAASGVQRRLLGNDYRDLWTLPVRVAVLNPDTFAGGLRVLQRGGGKQTVSLRLQGADGREYVFRSVDKDQTGGLPEDFKETLIDDIAQDQVSSKHPASALIAAPLLRAAGVLHATPQLAVMPDHPFLGEHREEFAGMLGIIEERPNEPEDGGRGFAGAVRVAGTETVLDHLEDSPVHRVDARAYLRARLMDFLLGDWDRHADQWRWARFDRDGRHEWHPIPRDRDNAFSRYDGMLMDMVRSGAPMLVEFGERYPDLEGLMLLAQTLDRRLLSELPRAAFDSAAVELQRRLPDPVIDAAVAGAPPEYHARRGAELARQLKARREGLPEIARRFYGRLADQAEVRATDVAEIAEIDRLPDGAVEVRIAALGEAGQAERPDFSRRFLPDETREIRVYLHGGDDRAVVRGSAARSIRVRVVGGGDDDVLVDSSSVGGWGRRTAFYDDRGENRIEAGREATVDTRPYRTGSDGEAAESAASADSTDAGESAGARGQLDNNLPATRDWGSQLRWFQPWVEWRYNAGPVVGGGPSYTRYGFRQDPYDYHLGSRVLYAPLESRFGLELVGDFRRVNSPSRLEVLARASQLEVVRFHGFGNETESAGADDRYKIWHTEYLLEPVYVAGLSRSTSLFAGPVVRYTDPELPADNPAALGNRPFGSEAFGQVGAQLGAQLDTRDLAAYPRRGLFARARGAAYPAAWEVPEAFGMTEARAAAYLPLPLPLETTLAVRAGAERAWGAYPFQQAAFVGGSETLRGYPRQRFAGDAAVYGGAELRSFLTRFNFISRGDLGVIALADAGRVFVDGQSSDRWHTGFGGGFWVGVLERTRTFSLVYAHGEEGSLYLSFGTPF